MEAMEQLLQNPEYDDKSVLICERKPKEGDPSTEETSFYALPICSRDENPELIRKSSDPVMKRVMRFNHEMHHLHPTLKVTSMAGILPKITPIAGHSTLKFTPTAKPLRPILKLSGALKVQCLEKKALNCAIIRDKCDETMFDGEIFVLTPSRILAFGGFRTYVKDAYDAPTLGTSIAVLSRRVRWYDYPRPPGGGWVEGNPMISERGRGGGQDHQVVGLHDKLFVFGGGSSLPITGDDAVWAEVHNLDTGIWVPLAAPPEALKSGYLSSAVFGSQKILLGSSSSSEFFTYDVELDEWKALDPPEFGPHFFNNFGNTSRPVVVGAVIYWVYRELHAYDLDTKRFYTGPILDIAVDKFLDNADVKTLYDDPPHLVHLASCDNGELFCLVWKPMPSTVHCTRFRVYKEEETIEDGVYLLSAPVQSCTLFTLR